MEDKTCKKQVGEINDALINNVKKRLLGGNPTHFIVFIVNLLKFDKISQFWKQVLKQNKGKLAKWIMAYDNAHLVHPI